MGSMYGLDGSNIVELYNWWECINVLFVLNLWQYSFEANHALLRSSAPSGAIFSEFVLGL